MLNEEPSDEWLEGINASFVNEGVVPGERPKKAIDSWFCGKSQGPFGPIGTPAFARIMGWFMTNTKFGDELAEPIRYSVFFFDHSFWALNVPLPIGNRICIDPFKYLQMNAEATRNMLRKDTVALEALNNHLEREIDLLLTVENIHKKIETGRFVPNGWPLLLSADLHLQAAAALLRLPQPNPRVIELIRFSVEIALKAFISAHDGFPDVRWDDGKFRTETLSIKNGHDLDALFDLATARGECSLFAKLELSMFPKVEARYSATPRSLSDSWHAYQLGLDYVFMAVRYIEASLLNSKHVGRVE